MSTPDTPETLQLAVQAAARGDVGELSRLAALEPQLLHIRTADGDTLLGLACRAVTDGVALPPVPCTEEQLAAIDWLLAAGVDVSAATLEGWAPLHAAAMTGNLELAHRLLAAGAAREGRLLGTSGGSPLSLALFYGKSEVAEVLAEPAIPDNLRTAAALGRSLDRFFDGDERLPSARVGIDFYRPLPAFPEWQRTGDRQELLDEALTWSARNGRLGSMSVLIHRGALVNANPYRGTALLWAVFADNVEAAAWLLHHGADMNLRHDFGGATHGKGAVALHLAAQYSRLKCLKLLLDRGADRTIKDELYQATPLGWAEHEGAQDSVALLTA